MTQNIPKMVYTKEDIESGITIGQFFYTTTGGIWIDDKQIAGTCDKPYRYFIGRLVRAKRIKGGFTAAKKAMLAAGVYGVYADTILRDL